VQRRHAEGECNLKFELSINEKGNDRARRGRGRRGVNLRVDAGQKGERREGIQRGSGEIIFPSSFWRTARRRIRSRNNSVGKFSTLARNPSRPFSTSSPPPVTPSQPSSSVPFPDAPHDFRVLALSRLAGSASSDRKGGCSALDVIIIVIIPR